jgi:hypothetical protein
MRVLLASRSGAAEIGHFLPERKYFEVRGIDVSGRYAYLAAGSSGMSVLRISDPKNPVEVARFDISNGGARSIRVSGSRAYVGDRSGVTVLDISDPKTPRKLDYHKTPATAERIWISDSKVYVAAREAGLVILDAENRSHSDNP